MKCEKFNVCSNVSGQCLVRPDKYPCFYLDENNSKQSNNEKLQQEPINPIITLPSGEKIDRNFALREITLNLQADLDWNEDCCNRHGDILNDDIKVIPREWISRGVLKNWIAVLKAFSND